ncbi:MAG: glycosyltransferase [Armatimonadetes bacterium]|nr:glycosyltransferase [Armatimonadota bacterium]
MGPVSDVALGLERSPAITILIPAFREGKRIAATVAAARRGAEGWGPVEIVVVDDGSPDDTAAQAEAAGADRVLRLARNRGKGGALRAGLAAAGGDLLVTLDADLGESAIGWPALAAPIAAGEADLTIAVLPPVGKAGGFGWALRAARWGVQMLTGRRLEAPLSGQRAFSRTTWEQIGRLDPGFGAEVGMDVDALRAGLRVVEIRTDMCHRPTGRTLPGFAHRARQMVAVLRALARRMGGQ